MCYNDNANMITLSQTGRRGGEHVSEGGKRGRPTLEDVARLAGVSPITVSRAIRGSAPVNAQTKRRIDEAIAALGYVPNEAARRLVRGQASDRVGVIVHNAAHYLWSRISFVIQADLVRRGFIPVLADTRESPAEELRQWGELLRLGVCGVIASPRGLDSPLPGLVREQGLPLVLMNSGPDEACDTVAMDEAGGMQQLTRHLLQEGHRRIAIVHRAPTTFAAAARRAGYEAALREAGIPPDPRLVEEAIGGDVDAAIGRLLALPEPPTAIIAAASWAAFRALHALARRRIRVPDEIEVAAFGEMPTFGNLLAHVSYEPVEELATRAVEMLVERINGYSGPARRYVHPVRVIPRARGAGEATPEAGGGD